MEGGKEHRDAARRLVGAEGSSRDLVPKLVRRGGAATGNAGREREELELSLGLSTNGRFGVDLASKRMRRSSSVANVTLNADSAGNGGPEPVRTCSLPPEFGRPRMDTLKSVAGGTGQQVHAAANGALKPNDAGSRELPKPPPVESKGNLVNDKILKHHFRLNLVAIIAFYRVSGSYAGWNGLYIACSCIGDHAFGLVEQRRRQALWL
ncbi:hypothetical protein SASPL_123108 [Salvia splendens]|uniref:Ethylene-responsive binding factor-associated repression domain-containing protein n=1 Tax=Salvia splendens TaxID=180675 RepID=A0A8X8ZTM8_SALSN|nr:hypothetical protein SASPL_123108 [Salvia splendens]